MKHTPERATCDDCEVNWDRKGNVKTVVLCHLHTAAPELLKALERGIALVKNINTVEGNDADTSFGLNWLKEARAVIKKATK